MATTQTIGIGLWVVLCVAGFVPLHAAQEEAEEKYPQHSPALEAQDPEAEEAYHVRKPLALKKHTFYTYSIFSH